MFVSVNAQRINVVLWIIIAMNLYNIHDINPYLSSVYYKILLNDGSKTSY